MSLQCTLLQPIVVLILTCTLSIVGCVSSNGSLTEVEQHPSLDYELTGIPPLFFGFGTSVPLTPQLSLTAAHVAKVNHDNVISYHPNCDIAIIESDNQAVKYPSLGLIYPFQAVQTFGMSPTGEVLSGIGVYHRDLMLIETFYFRECPASITDAPVQDGMSGGGVYSSSGALVGIIAARAEPDEIRLLNGEQHGLERISIFVALHFVRDWLEDEVSSYYGGEHYNLQWKLDRHEADELLAQNE